MRIALALFASTSLIFMTGTAMAQEAIVSAPEEQTAVSSATPPTEQMPVAVPQQVSDFTVASSGQIASGRIFKEQQINLTTEPVAEIDFSVTHNKTGLYGYVWVAESLVGRPQDRERDFQFGKDTPLNPSGDVIYRAEIAYFEFEGPDEYRLRNRLTYPIGKKLTGTATFDVMRGQLDTEVLNTGISYAADRWSVSGNLAYDRAFDATGISGDLGWKPFANQPFRIILSGFTGNRDSGAIIKVKIW